MALNQPGSEFVVKFAGHKLSPEQEQRIEADIHAAVASALGHEPATTPIAILTKFKWRGLVAIDASKLQDLDVGRVQPTLTFNARV